MPIAGRGERSRPSRKRRSKAGPTPRKKGARGVPATFRIRWYPTRVPPKDEHPGRLRAWSTVVAPVGARGRARVVANQVPRGLPGRYVIDAAVREALSGLGGGWRARIAPLNAICVEIASPDGFRWRAFIPDPGKQGRRSLARRLKDACARSPASSGQTRWRSAWILVTPESC